VNHAAAAAGRMGPGAAARLLSGLAALHKIAGWLLGFGGSALSRSLPLRPRRDFGVGGAHRTLILRRPGSLVFPGAGERAFLARATVRTSIGVDMGNVCVDTITLVI
jgi:hypothetical protein